jgi:hypothetical protein
MIPFLNQGENVQAKSCAAKPTTLPLDSEKEEHPQMLLGCSPLFWFYREFSRPDIKIKDSKRQA